MDIVDKLRDTIGAAVTGGRHQPVGTVHVVDPSPLNWLYVTYNTVEELVRTGSTGLTVPAAMTAYRWVDDRTLEIDVRDDERFPDGRADENLDGVPETPVAGEPLTAATVKRAFDEVMRWRSPHPPGSQFTLDPRTRMEVVRDAPGERRVRILLAEPDGFAVGKLRAMHLMHTRFWERVGFGYARVGTGEGRW